MKQREVVEEIQKAGGEVAYDYQHDQHDTTSKPPGPRWLRELLGDDFFADVTRVFRLTEPGFDDALLPRIGQLTRLQELLLRGIDDAGLKHLKGLTQLHSLDLGLTKVGDAGLEHLKGLTQLRALWAPRHQGQRRRTGTA